MVPPPAQHHKIMCKTLYKTPTGGKNKTHLQIKQDPKHHQKQGHLPVESHKVCCATLDFAYLSQDARHKTQLPIAKDKLDMVSIVLSFR